jgi:preprotein translocase subunit SecG
MHTVLLVLHIALGLGLIVIILLQQGAGATAGAAFGSGASSTVFGSRGSTSFLTRATGILALIFFGNSFLLAYLSGQTITPQSVLERVQAPTPVEIPGATIDQLERDLPGLPQNGSPSDVPAIPGSVGIPAATSKQSEIALPELPQNGSPSDVPAIPE